MGGNGLAGMAHKRNFFFADARKIPIHNRPEDEQARGILGLCNSARLDIYCSGDAIRGAELRKEAGLW